MTFKEYYSYNLHGVGSTAHDVRFSLSASSIDSIYAVCRDSNYQTAGIKARNYVGVGDGHVANAFCFKAYNGAVTTARGAVRYNWTVNNVQHPMYQADILDATSDLINLTNQHGHGGRGNMVTSLNDFVNGKAVFPLVLNMPSNPIAVQSGYNSRGNNSQLSFSISGQTMEAASDAAQTSATLSTFVVVETTARLIISGAKQLSVSY